MDSFVFPFFWSGHDQGLVAKTSKIERYAKNVHRRFPAQNLMQRVRAKIQQGQPVWLRKH